MTRHIPQFDNHGNPWQILYHHDGSAYDKYKLKVHNIIIQNIADVSDAYTYVKSHIKIDNGSREIKTIRGRYENAAMHENYANEANRNLENVAHRN